MDAPPPSEEPTATEAPPAEAEPAPAPEEAAPVTDDAAPPPRGDPEEEIKAFVGGLAWEVSNEDLGKEFEKYQITSAFVATDKFSGRSRGFGFVCFETESGRQDAIADLHDKEMWGRRITVAPAVPRGSGGRDRGGRGGGRGGRFGGGGGGGRYGGGGGGGRYGGGGGGRYGGGGGGRDRYDDRPPRRYDDDRGGYGGGRGGYDDERPPSRYRDRSPPPSSY